MQHSKNNPADMFSHHRRGDRDRAIGEFSKAIEFGPKSAIAYSCRDTAYQKKGNLDRAARPMPTRRSRSRHN
jgi:Tfp pilus assembly protein PilF